MDEKDQDLDGMLGPLRQLQPSPLMKIRWQKAVDEAMARLPTEQPKKRRFDLVQLAVAAAIGFIFGAVLLSQLDIAADRPVNYCEPAIDP